MKHLISVVVCMALILSATSVPASASTENTSTVPCIVTNYEKTAGVIVNLFSKFINKITKTDETAVIKAEKKDNISKNTFGTIDMPEKEIDAVTYVAEELIFSSEKSYADPFSDVDIDLLLWNDKVSYKIPGFWDGGNIWKIRFICPEDGTWYYKTVCADDENTSLHGRTGKINCKKYDGELEIYKHGFVTTKDGEKYFTYADGTPFFYLGDTHWSLGDETVDMVKTIAEKRGAQGFTVFQSEPIGAKFDVSDGISESDTEGFRDYDEKFRIIAENGLVHANAQFFFPYYMEVLINNFGGYSDTLISAEADGKNLQMKDLSDTVKTYLEKLSRYWVARYGAYPVMWTLGQEIDNDFYTADTSHPDWNFINNPYKLVAEYIEKYDAFAQPLTGHQENCAATACYGDGKNTKDDLRVYKDGSAASCLRDLASHDFFAAQWTPSKTSQSDFKIEKDYWYNSQGKPSINYEGHYCYLWTKNFGARMQGWTAYLNGMYGYGWGAHDTWSYLNTFDEDTRSSDGVDTITSEEKKAATWEDALEYESSYQMGYMKEFFGNTRWNELIPRFDNHAYFVPCNNVYYVYAGNKDNSEIVIYFYSFTDSGIAEKTNTKKYGGILTGTVGNLEPRAEYSYRWFDPVNGEYSEKFSFTASVFGTHFFGERPDDTDYVLHITKE